MLAYSMAWRNNHDILNYIIREFDYPITELEKRFLLKLIHTDFPTRGYAMIARHKTFNLEDLIRSIEKKDYIEVPGIGGKTVSHLREWIARYRN